MGFITKCSLRPGWLFVKGFLLKQKNFENFEKYIGNNECSVDLKYIHIETNCGRELCLIKNVALCLELQLILC